MFRKSIPMVALAALFAVTMAYAQEGSTTTSGSAPAATTPAPAKSPAKSSTHSSSSHAHAAKIDLNSASKEQLMTLKGVGDATADKIIAARPFKSKSELTSKGIVTKKEYEAISAKVIAHQETAAKPATK
jgi:competence protein ComEA